MPTPKEAYAIVLGTAQDPEAEKAPGQLALGRALAEDVPGQPALTAGTTIGPAQLALLAGLDRIEIPVFAPVAVGLVTVDDALSGNETGEEMLLTPAGAALAAAGARAGQLPIDMGATPPHAELHQAALRRAFDLAEIVCTLGGSPELLETSLRSLNGEFLFREVAQNPGADFSCALLEDGWWFGLPGDPAAAWLLFELYVRPFARRMAGHRDLDLPAVAVEWPAPFAASPIHRWRWARRENNRSARLSRPAADRAPDLAEAASAEGIVSLPPGDPTATALLFQTG